MVPLPVPLPAKLAIPVCTPSVPLLLQATELAKLVAPVPAVLRKEPALLKVALLLMPA